MPIQVYTKDSTLLKYRDIGPAHVKFNKNVLNDCHNGVLHYKPGCCFIKTSFVTQFLDFTLDFYARDKSVL